MRQFSEKSQLTKVCSENEVLVSLPNCEDVSAIATEILERNSPIVKESAPK